MIGALGATNSVAGLTAGCGGGTGGGGGAGGGGTVAGGGVGGTVIGLIVVGGPPPGLPSGFFLNTDTISLLLHAGHVLSHASGS